MAWGHRHGVGAGDDHLDGGAGSDKIDGGSGNDTITFDDWDASVDGGDGIDTLLISGNNLDFSNLHADGVIQNIERLDLNVDGQQTVTLSLDNILDMTGDAHLLQLTGTADDTVIIKGKGWTQYADNSGLFTNVVQGEIVSIDTSGDDGKDIKIDFPDTPNI